MIHTGSFEPVETYFIRTERIKITKKNVRESKTKKEKKRRKSIIVGAEEKDRAIGRTLKRSLSQFGHSPGRFAGDDLVAGLVVVEARAAGPCRRARWIRVLVVMCSRLTLILAHSRIHCHSNFRKLSSRCDPYHWMGSW
jgi:hypothetical protein